MKHYLSLFTLLTLTLHAVGTMFAESAGAPLNPLYTSSTSANEAQENEIQQKSILQRCKNFVRTNWEERPVATALTAVALTATLYWRRPICNSIYESLKACCSTKTSKKGQSKVQKTPDMAIVPPDTLASSSTSTGWKGDIIDAVAKAQNRLKKYMDKVNQGHTTPAPEFETLRKLFAERGDELQALGVKVKDVLKPFDPESTQANLQAILDALKS